MGALIKQATTITNIQLQVCRERSLETIGSSLTIDEKQCSRSLFDTTGQFENGIF
jgi:hypothetical protein